MTEESPDSSPGRLLPAEARTLYARLSAGETVSGDTPGLDALIGRGIALTDPLSGLVGVVDLDHVEQRLHGAVRDSLARSVELFGELHAAIDDLRARQPDAGRSGASSFVRFVEGRDAVNRSISAACDTAREELLAAQSGPRPRRVLTRTRDRDRNLLDRGVSLRTLYPASGRTDAAVRERVEFMAPRGARFRTLAAPFLRMMVFDRRLAYLVDRVSGRPEEEGAWEVRDPAVGAFLADVFEQQWDRAEEWGRPAPTGAEALSTPLQRAILRALCAGQDQQQIANALGYSARTINARLTELRARLGIRTVYQLVHWWATSPERALD